MRTAREWGVVSKRQKAVLVGSVASSAPRRLKAGDFKGSLSYIAGSASGLSYIPRTWVMRMKINRERRRKKWRKQRWQGLG